MASVLLTKAYPGIPASTVFTTDASGRYVAAGGAWFEASYVLAHPDTFITPAVSTVVWTVANADGTTTTATNVQNVAGIKANYFSQSARGQEAASASATLMIQYKT